MAHMARGFRGVLVHHHTKGVSLRAPSFLRRLHKG